MSKTLQRSRRRMQERARLVDGKVGEQDVSESRNVRGHDGVARQDAAERADQVEPLQAPRRARFSAIK